jgi:electron transfer flavoprotein alpha subunit
MGKVPSRSYGNSSQNQRGVIFGIKEEVYMETEKNVLVFLEMERGSLHPQAKEVIGAGRQLAQALDGNLSAVVMGEGALSDTAANVRHYGVDRIYVVENSLLEIYHGEYFCSTLKEVCRTARPTIILMANTLLGSDLAPRLAWDMESGLISDCTAIEKVDGEIAFTKPIYSGNVMAVYAPKTTPTLVTLRPRAFMPQTPLDTAYGEIVPLSIYISEGAARTTVVERIEEEGECIRLGSAKRIVAGGRGIGNVEGFALLKMMADTLGASIGASRPACDLGWVSPKAQVGQTGEIVAPDIYFAVGISGSTQHLAGMSDSKIIIAINNDPRANIFKVADYGVVGNYEDVIPVIIETLRGILVQKEGDI